MLIMDNTRQAEVEHKNDMTWVVEEMLLAHRGLA
jgi:hypothetical protein